MSIVDVLTIYLLLGRKSTDPESDGSRPGSSLSLRNIAGNEGAAASYPQEQSPRYRGVHRSIILISASSTKPIKRASSGSVTLRVGPTAAVTAAWWRWQQRDASAAIGSGPTAVDNSGSNNHSSKASSGISERMSVSSNFKRQKKENTARLAAQNQRPASSITKPLQTIHIGR